MNRMRHILYLLPAAMLLASCTQDEVTDNGQGTLLAEPVPLQLTAAIGDAVTTRAGTVDGQWPAGGGTVYVQISEDEDGLEAASVLAYSVDANGNLTPPEDVETIYWTHNDQTFYVRAWYAAAQTTLPGTWEVQTDQSTDTNYEKSDFLYARQTADFSTGKSGVSLAFYHQVAKVKVNVLRGTDTPADITSVTSLTIKDVATSGTFSDLNFDGATGKWSAGSGQRQDITPHAGTATGDNMLATYEAIVIPQNNSYPNGLFTITAEGYNSFVYTPVPDITWESGREYTYNITIKGSGLEVTTGTITGWSTGGTGSGSVAVE